MDEAGLAKRVQPFLHKLVASGHRFAAQSSTTKQSTGGEIMSAFSVSYRKAIRLAAVTLLVMGYTFGTVALVSFSSSPAVAKAKKKVQKVQNTKKSKGNKSGSHHGGGGGGGGGILGFGLGDGINIYIGR
jgi:hypothetical protein